MEPKSIATKGSKRLLDLPIRDGNFGVSAEDATEVFKDSVLKEAEKTADGLVDQFSNPQLRNVFIRALERMGQDGGQALLSQVAKAMSKVEDEVLTLEQRLQPLLAAQYGEEVARRTQGDEWEITLLRENQTEEVYQLTNGVQYLSTSISKMAEKASGAMEWTYAVDFSGMATRAQTSLDTLGGYSKQLGSNVGGNLYSGIMEGVVKAVEEAKRQLATLSVNVRVNSAATTGSLTDSMRSDL